jgi:hypothetical protein
LDKDFEIVQLQHQLILQARLFVQLEARIAELENNQKKNQQQ